MQLRALIFASALALAAAAGQRDAMHPVEKVILMLKGLSAKAEFDGKQEALTYEKFVYWCTNSQKELSTAIAKNEEKVETLTDSIAGKEQQQKTLEDEINDLVTELLKSQQEAFEAKKVRDDTASAYADTMADFKSTLDAINEAIKLVDDSRNLPSFQQILSKPAVRTALALLEASTPNEDQRGSIASLLQGESVGTASAPAAAPYGYADKDRPDLIVRGGLEDHVQKYKFKSDNVVELLKELRLKFEDEKTAAETAETNSLNAYALAKQAREAAEKAINDSMTEKDNLLGEVKTALVKFRADLKSAQDDLAADKSSLESNQKTCLMKKEEWEERTEVRKQEREAVAAAIKILAEVADVRTEAPENPVPPPQPTGLLQQLSFLQVAAQTPEEKAMSLLRAASQSTHSKALARLAQQIAIEPHGHFGAVINSIEKMIFKLQDEQMDEDKHKAWCDKEDAQTKASKSDKEDKLEELNNKIKLDQAQIQQLTEEIAEADDMVADITKFMADATEIRNAGKAENKEAIKDSQDAQEAIASATAVLETFYKESGMIEKASYEFVQQPVQLSPEPSTWSASYTGIADPKNQPGGIVTLLQTTSAEFAKMEADTRAQEATDQQAYDDQMQKSTIDKARRAKESEMKNNEKKGVSDRLTETLKRKKHLVGELEAVNQYLKDLEPACVTGDSTYDDRKAARAQEIEALHEAQAILTDAFKSQGKKTSFLSLRGLASRH